MSSSDQTERRVVTLLLGLSIAGAVVALVFYSIIEGQGPNTFFALIGFILLAGAFALYRRGYRWGRYAPVIVVVILVGGLLPEPYASQDFSMVVYMPAVMALLLADSRWIVGVSLATYGLLLARGWPDTVYREPIGLLISLLLISGIALAHQLTHTARQRAEEQARLLDEERRQLELRVAERTRALAAANDELREAGRLKDLFLAGVSHELRTPLNIILGNLELLRERFYGPLDDRQERALATVHESGEHLLQLINDLLDMARLQAGGFSIRRDQVPLGDLCRQCARLVQADVERKGLSLNLAISPFAATVVGDPQRLRQILLNLLNNAIKFTPAGGAIELSLGLADQGRSVEVAVSDTGIGVGHEQLGRLFKPFSQVDQRLSREYGGTGLGLALVAQLAQLHGGSVGVSSTPGVGSRFWVRLPALGTGA